MEKRAEGREDGERGQTRKIREQRRERRVLWTGEAVDNDNDKEADAWEMRIGGGLGNITWFDQPITGRRRRQCAGTLSRQSLVSELISRAPSLQ
jgi:hypothetical protein